MGNGVLFTALILAFNRPILQENAIYLSRKCSKMFPHSLAQVYFFQTRDYDISYKRYRCLNFIYIMNKFTRSINFFWGIIRITVHVLVCGALFNPILSVAAVSFPVVSVCVCILFRDFAHISIFRTVVPWSIVVHFYWHPRKLDAYTEYIYTTSVEVHFIRVAVLRLLKGRKSRYNERLCNIQDGTISIYEGERSYNKPENAQRVDLFQKITFSCIRRGSFTTYFGNYMF